MLLTDLDHCIFIDHECIYVTMKFVYHVRSNFWGTVFISNRSPGVPVNGFNPVFMQPFLHFT